MTDKPFQSYEELIKKLRGRGLHIDNDEYAIEILKSKSYYGLINAFKTELSYRDDNGIEHFKDGTDFKDLIANYTIENELKSLLLKFSIVAEIRVKEAVAHELADTFGESEIDYLNFNNFKNRNRRISITNQIKEVAQTTSNNPTAYYRNNHDVIPPWILLPNLMLGQFRMLYGILESDQTENICESILYLDEPNEEQVGFIKTALAILNDFRNTLAHGSRLINYKATHEPISFQTIQLVCGPEFITEEEYNEQHIGADDLLSLIYIIMKLCGQIDSELFKNELNNLFNVFRGYPQFEMYYKSTNLPIDLDRRLELLN